MGTTRLSWKMIMTMHGLMLSLKVLVIIRSGFPRDIGSSKRDRLSGNIIEVGMGLYHKYRGMAAAKIEASSGFYLCPLSSLVPNPSMKCRGSAEIASGTGENPCRVILYWHEYGGYTVVSGDY
jgi:hypothetical protein